jgi:heme A synthase
MRPLKTQLSKFTWGITLYNIFVVLWGAYVRATGSGAGCGNHWPLCNGEVIPRSEAVETAIEFTHRITSGLAFLLVLWMLIWVIRRYEANHPIRVYAWGAMAFMISESLVGAALVLFNWVAGNISVARVIVMGIHLANTMMLLAFLALTAWTASGGAPTLWRKPGRVKWLLLAGFLGVLLMSMAGAVTALGDTLFPAETLVEGLQQDFSPTANFLVRLRVWHPVFAVAMGIYLVYLTQYIREKYNQTEVRRSTISVLILFAVQLAAGATNLILLAPIWMQIIHLFLATLVWLALTLLAALVLSNE